jgi:carbon starvation protein
MEKMDTLAKEVGEKTLFNRSGGAATLAVGMAQIFSKAVHGRWLDLWYHFAIMFEALFILTTLDAGTRVGRYLLQDALGNLWKPLADTKVFGPNVLASILIVTGWGYFLIQGVRDPDGGVKALWPLFGIANQLLASIALCLATTIILKMQLKPAAPELVGQSTERGSPSPAAAPKPLVRRPAFALVTLVPLLWLLAVTMTAGLETIFHHEADPKRPRIGFLQKASELNNKLPDLQTALTAAEKTGNKELILTAQKLLRNNRMLYFNNMVDAVVAGIFLTLVSMIFLLSIREWVLLLARQRLASLHETPPVWLPEYAVAEGQPLRLFSLLALALALAKELSGEAYLERAQITTSACKCTELGCAGGLGASALTVDLLGQRREGQNREIQQRVYVEAVEQRFKRVNRCC